MAQWLRGRTRFQRIALALLVAAGTAWLYYYLADKSTPGTLVIVAAFFVFAAFRRQLLWRVRNRLLITYFLFGVVPIVVIFWLLQVSMVMALGQIAINRVRHDIEARIASVQAITRDLALAVSQNGSAGMLDEIRRREPRLTAVAVAHGKPVSMPPEGGPFSAAPDWLGPEFHGIFRSGDRYYLGAIARSAEGASAFSYLPLDNQTLATITPGVVEVLGVTEGDGDADPTFNFKGSRVGITQKNGERIVFVFSRSPQGRNFLDITVATLLHWPAETGPGTVSQVAFPIMSRPSMLLADTSDQFGSVSLVLIILGVFFVVVEIVSVISSVSLTRTITRSVHDLYQGTQRAAAGDFSHQIPVRGQHQLSDLAASFNGMTSQISHYLLEMRKKEKLESEIEIARQVQARLFPGAVPQLRTLEMWGVCLPGRFVSGDYYDFVRLDNRFTAIVLGDVSGKGVSAALLMASIQSSLHAQLKFSGAPTSPGLSTATLMGLIGQQLYESTPPEKYATFFCSVYDDETGLLRYTNCGHLKPILIREGNATALEGDGMVVGLLPNIRYDQHEFQMRQGDLLAIFSDGIPEAENSSEQEFGEERLGELLAKRAAEPLAAIISVVTEAVREWTYDPDGRDDTTIVLLRKLG